MNFRHKTAQLLLHFVSCGDPSLDFTKKLVKTVCRAGADIVELGVPFSDPMADGAVIQASSQRALAAGTTILSAIEMACGFEERRNRQTVCIVFVF
ncbi:MAG: tryptophan synthase subunit alpha [Bacilli bacterium]